eukprot:11219935-Lingulodinium_polyedra.AAC.1
MERPWRGHGEAIERPWRGHGEDMERTWRGQSADQPTCHALSTAVPWSVHDFCKAFQRLSH